MAGVLGPPGRRFDRSDVYVWHVGDDRAQR
jgi:hypothetical protein